MYRARVRIRTLMVAIAIVALLCWAGLAWWDWYHRDQGIEPFDVLEMSPRRRHRSIAA